MNDTLRYLQNIGPLSEDEQKALTNSRICVVGCGGLGGYVIEQLGRLGVGYITAVDGDNFEPTNLNRQLLCTENNLGNSKANAAALRLEQINSSITCNPIVQFLTEENGQAIIEGHHLVIDALDNVRSRFILQQICCDLSIPLIHGAVDGWFAQVCTVFPGDHIFERIYPSLQEPAASGNLGITAAFAASMEVAMAIKVLTGNGDTLRGNILFADLQSIHFDILPLI